MTEQTTTLEEQTPFSRSLLWQYQRDFFNRQGIHAWASLVPFYITSNPFIANSYAEVIIGYIKDLMKQQTLSFDTPLYILELGTGSGRFSYYCMTRIFELQAAYKLQKIKLCYIMSDFTDLNLKFWISHDRFIPYIEAQKLDFSVFDLEQDSQITLYHQKTVLRAGSLKNPLIVLGNYIFDTISHDAFRANEGKLSHLLTTLTTPTSNLSENIPQQLDKVTTTFHPAPMDPLGHYPDPIYNEILQDYAQRFKNTSFLFPVGGLKTIKTLHSWHGADLLLLSTDKGYALPEELDYHGDPTVTFHGSFSMMVNFHAMGEYFKKTGGDVFCQSLRKSIKTMAFVYGNAFLGLPETKHALHQYIEEFGPGDFFNLHEHFKVKTQESDLKALDSLLRLSRWDPHVYHYLADKIAHSISKEDTTLKQSLQEGMKKILQNMYLMPNVYNTFFDVAIFYHATEAYQTALHYYEKSREHFGDDFNTLYNMALCFYSLGEKVQAQDYFNHALKKDPNSKVTQEWLDRIQNEPT